MIILWIIFTAVLIILPLYWHLSDWKTTVKVCTIAYSKNMTYFGNNMECAFLKSMNDRYKARQKYIVPLMQLKEACATSASIYDDDKVYNLPNLIFFCLCFDMNSVLKKDNLDEVYQWICALTHRDPRYRAQTEQAFKNIDIVIEIQENFVNSLTRYV